MAGVRANVSLSIDATLSGTGDLGDPKQRILIEKALSLAAGTAATDEANILFSDSRTLAASATENLDLAGALTSAFGATITAAEIVLLYFFAHASNTNDVQVTRPASNGLVGPFMAAGDGVAIKPGEWAVFVSQAGWPVTAATGDLLTVTNSAGSTGVDYDVVIIGRTVAA